MNRVIVPMHRENPDYATVVRMDPCQKHAGMTGSRSRLKDCRDDELLSSFKIALDSSPSPSYD